MGVKGMWQVNAVSLVILIVCNLAMTFMGETLWIALSAAALLLMMFFCLRQGMGIGHGACGVSGTVARAREAGDRVYAQLDRSYLSQAWSVETGVKGLLASALIPYAAGSIYIILCLIDSPALEIPTLVARILAWLLSLPFWPLIMHWHESFVTLTPAIGAMLLISPFVLPACTFLGYLQGPRLWARTEDAMKQGRRRAKARARVGKKLAPKAQKPEI